MLLCSQAVVDARVCAQLLMVHRGCAADLRSLARLIPARSRLLLRPPVDTVPAVTAAADGDDAAEVATSSVRAGDMLLVRPCPKPKS